MRHDVNGKEKKKLQIKISTHSVMCACLLARSPRGQTRAITHTPCMLSSNSLLYTMQSKISHGRSANREQQTRVLRVYALSTPLAPHIRLAKHFVKQRACCASRALCHRFSSREPLRAALHNGQAALFKWLAFLLLTFALKQIELRVAVLEQRLCKQLCNTVPRNALVAQTRGKRCSCCFAS